MNEVVARFTSIIRSSHFSLEQATGQKRVERCELVFTDALRLVGYESSTGAKFKYSYQWMDAANQTIFRWDNATHFPQFDTFPFHRHVGGNEVPEAFPMITFLETLQFIADQLATQAH